MDEETRPETVLRELLTTQKLGVLSTQGSGRPHGSLVAFAATDDLKSIVFATSRATRKFANLVADERAAMVIDSRSNRESDFHAASAITLTGRAREVTGPPRESMAALYLAKHPSLRGFLASPSCAVLVFSVDNFRVVHSFPTGKESEASDASRDEAR